MGWICILDFASAVRSTAANQALETEVDIVGESKTNTKHTLKHSIAVKRRLEGEEQERILGLNASFRQE